MVAAAAAALALAFLVAACRPAEAKVAEIGPTASCQSWCCGCGCGLLEAEARAAAVVPPTCGGPKGLSAQIRQPYYAASAPAGLHCRHSASPMQPQHAAKALGGCLNSRLQLQSLPCCPTLLPGPQVCIGGARDPLALLQHRLHMRADLSCLHCSALSADLHWRHPGPAAGRQRRLQVQPPG